MPASSWTDAVYLFRAWCIIIVVITQQIFFLKYSYTAIYQASLIYKEINFHLEYTSRQERESKYNI